MWQRDSLGSLETLTLMFWIHCLKVKTKNETFSETAYSETETKKKDG